MHWAVDFIEAINEVDGISFIIGKYLLITIVFLIQKLAQEVVLQFWDKVLEVFV